MAWLSAKSQGGRIVLRIEDLDAERCPRIYADLLEQDLDWLGLAETLTYFVVFSVLIKAKDLPTPGREAARSADQSPYADPQAVSYTHR